MNINEISYIHIIIKHKLDSNQCPSWGKPVWVEHENQAQDYSLYGLYIFNIILFNPLSVVSNMMQRIMRFV